MKYYLKVYILPILLAFICAAILYIGFTTLLAIAGFDWDRSGAIWKYMIAGVAVVLFTCFRVLFRRLLNKTVIEKYKIVNPDNDPLIGKTIRYDGKDIVIYKSTYVMDGNYKKTNEKDYRGYYIKNGAQIQHENILNENDIKSLLKEPK